MPLGLPEVVYLNDFVMLILSVDWEAENGQPEAAKAFKSHVEEADGIIVSFAEHKGSYSAAFKNIMDCTSRLEGKTWAEKPMLLLATSPGGRGGKSLLHAANTQFPFLGGKVTGSFSLPSFYQNFSAEEGIKDEQLNLSFREQIASFQAAL